MELASLARPLLACAWISFVYLLHGIKVTECTVQQPPSVARTINNSSKARCTRNFKLHCTCAVQSRSRDLTSLTTNYLYNTSSISQPKTRYLAFSYQQRRQKRRLGEKFLPPLRFCVQEEAAPRSCKPPRRLRMSHRLYIVDHNYYWFDILCVDTSRWLNEFD